MTVFPQSVVTDLEATFPGRGGRVELFVAVAGDQRESLSACGDSDGDAAGMVAWRENHTSGAGGSGVAARVGGSGMRPRLDSCAGAI